MACPCDDTCLGRGVRAGPATPVAVICNLAGVSDINEVELIEECFQEVDDCTQKWTRVTIVQFLGGEQQPPDTLDPVWVDPAGTVSNVGPVGPIERCKDCCDDCDILCVNEPTTAVQLFTFDENTEAVQRLNGVTGEILESHSPVGVDWGFGSVHDTNNSRYYLYDNVGGVWHWYDTEDIAAGNNILPAFTGDPIVGAINFGAFDPASGFGYIGQDILTRYRVDFVSQTITAIPVISGIPAGKLPSSLSIDRAGRHYITVIDFPVIGPNTWLYELNPTTGAATLIDTILGPAINGSDYDQLSSGGWFGTDKTAGKLYQWTQSNGADITEIGDVTVAPSMAVGAVTTEFKRTPFRRCYGCDATNYSDSTLTGEPFIVPNEEWVGICPSDGSTSIQTVKVDCNNPGPKLCYQKTVAGTVLLTLDNGSDDFVAAGDNLSTTQNLRLPDNTILTTVIQRFTGTGLIQDTTTFVNGQLGAEITTPVGPVTQWRMTFSKPIAGSFSVAIDDIGPDESVGGWTIVPDTIVPTADGFLYTWNASLTGATQLEFQVDNIGVENSIFVTPFSGEFDQVAFVGEVISFFDCDTSRVIYRDTLNNEVVDDPLFVDCPAGHEFEVKKLCERLDPNTGQYASFLRRYRIESDGGVTVVDTELDGVTPYNVANELEVSACPDIAAEDVCYQRFNLLGGPTTTGDFSGLDSEGNRTTRAGAFGGTFVTVVTDLPQGPTAGLEISLPVDSPFPKSQVVKLIFSRPIANFAINVADLNNVVGNVQRLHSFNVFPDSLGLGSLDISNGQSVEATGLASEGILQWDNLALTELVFTYEVYESPASPNQAFSLGAFSFDETTGTLEIRKAAMVIDTNSLVRYVDKLSGLNLSTSDVILTDCPDESEYLQVEVGCLSSPASVDLTTATRCAVTRVIVNGENYNVDLGADWSVQELVDAINLQEPGLLGIDGTTVVVLPGQSMGSLELICDIPDFIEDFGFNGQDGARLSTTATNYTFTPSGTIFDTFYAITSFQDTGLEVWNNNEGNIVTDASGDANGNAFIVAANVDPGEFYRQQVNGLVVGREYSVSFYGINTTSYLGTIEPNIRVDIEDLASNVLATSETGDIPRTDDGVWVKFTFDFVAPETNVEFVLVNNAPGGGGNDLAIDAIRFNRVSRQYFNLLPRGVLTPVEVVKTLNVSGDITSLRVYSPDGTIEYQIPDPNGLVLASGQCPVINAESSITQQDMQVFDTVLSSGDPDFTIPVGTLSYSVYVESGTATINGASRPTGYAINQSSNSHGGFRLLYPEIIISDILGTIHVSYVYI